MDSLTMNINHEIISFSDIPILASNAQKSVLLVRHSYRESLQNGNMDPGLTVEGFDYAVECGTFLTGLKDVCFGSSPRKRTIQTIQALAQGGNLAAKDIAIIPYDQLYDTAMFSPPEALGVAIDNHSLANLLNEYYSTGYAPGMVPLENFATNLANFLTQTKFEKKNVVLASHDIIIISLLTYFNVYKFQLNDWFGYVQGAFLYQNNNDQWTICYAVPDKNNRQVCQLFV